MKIINYTSSILITIVILLGIGLPMVQNPTEWYQFPVIPSLEDKFRNIFFHVPMSWVANIAFIVSTIYSLKYLNSKNLNFDIYAVTSAKLGMLFTILATVTGSIWAKFNWGSFWNWDPRQVSIVFLLLIYFAYFLLRSSIKNEVSRYNIAAVYNIIAGLSSIFFIFILPRMLTGLHPGAKSGEDTSPVIGGRIATNILVIFFISLTGFILFYIRLFKLNVRIEKLLKENNYV